MINWSRITCFAEGSVVGRARLAQPKETISKQKKRWEGNRFKQIFQRSKFIAGTIASFNPPSNLNHSAASDGDLESLVFSAFSPRFLH
jgi:hypothetical protein